MITERLLLDAERIREIPLELFEAAQAGKGGVAGPFADYFFRVSKELVLFLEEFDFIASGEIFEADIETLAEHNKEIYSDILPEYYADSYTNPAYCVSVLDKPEVPQGREYGLLMSAIAYEMRGMIPSVYDQNEDEAAIRLELFLEIYSAFTMEKSEADAAFDRDGTVLSGIPELRFIKKKLYSYLFDYAEDEAIYDRRRNLIADNDYAVSLVTEADLSDNRYLYYFGEYITENELLTADHLRALSDETISSMAETFTEGYRIGFINSGKDLDSKKTVSIEYHLGFERMIRRAVSNFEAMGKKCLIARDENTLFAMSHGRGYHGADPNPQYKYDHKEDLALVLDDQLSNRKLEAFEAAYKENAPDYAVYAGPAVLEAFGEEPFSPETGHPAARFDKAQQKLVADYRVKLLRLYNEAIIGKNRSFTIISYPLPEIADEPGIERTTEERNARYNEIFDEVIKINTLDYRKYQRIQQTIIDALDTADTLHITGRGDNVTDLTVNLWKLADKEHETIFENCVADVNIPVGEVFTSPVLEGTNGVLNVTNVYLEGLLYRDLKLEFKDGCISEYSCGNFAGEEDAEEKGREYIRENILFHHETLPMGECAIGTNTTAYSAGIKYNIQGRLPILIAEKTGPHFAVGDTCYSDDEDNIVYNPDGKQIVAKENSFTVLRKKDPSKAYFGCHTDITIPYSELGCIIAKAKDGGEIVIIRDGRFVLPGTEELNDALDA